MLRAFLSLKAGWSPWTKPVWSLSISPRITFSIPANVLSPNWLWAEQTDTVVCSVSWWIGINWHSRGDLKISDIAKHSADVLSRPFCKSADADFQAHFWLKLRKLGLCLQKKNKTKPASQKLGMKIGSGWYLPHGCKYLEPCTWEDPVFWTGPVFVGELDNSSHFDLVSSPLHWAFELCLLLGAPFQPLLNHAFTVSELFHKHF